MAARSNLRTISDMPEFIVWLPEEGFKQLVANLDKQEGPAIQVSTMLNLSHVYISDSDFQRYVVEDDGEVEEQGPVLNLFRYPKQLENYGEMPPDLRKIHVDERLAVESEINIGFSRYFRPK